MIAISRYAFEDCRTLESVIIPESVISIGRYAFRGCSSLVDIILPEKLTSIGRGAFIGCTAITKIIIPQGITSIGANLFEDCGSLQTVILPDRLSIIKYSAFLNCTSLADIEIPDTVTKIANLSFFNCESLKTFTIPAGVTKMNKNVFVGCYSLERITIYKSVKKIPDSAFIRQSPFAKGEKYHRLIICGEPGSEAERYAINEGFTFCDVTEPKSGSNGFYIRNSVLLQYSGDEENVLIPNGVSVIGEKAFKGNANLKSVVIPDSVSVISDYAFNCCKNLRFVCFGKGLVRIGEFAFNGCVRLQSVELPDSVKQIGECAFYGNKSLQRMNIPKNTETIGNSAFGDCTSITAFYIDKSNTHYYTKDGVLYNNSKNEMLHYPIGKTNDRFEISKNLVRLNEYDLCCNMYLKRIVTHPENQFYTTRDGVLYTKNMIELVVYPKEKEDEELVIPDSVLMISDCYISWNRHIKRVVIPESLDRFSLLQFHDCISLEKVTIPAGIDEIIRDSFTCDKLQDDGRVLYGCSMIPNLTICGKRGSAAERFAKENDLEFEELN